MSLWQQMRARWRLRRTVGIWYHPEYRARCLGTTSRVAHLELQRAEHILAALAQSGLVTQKSVETSPLASISDLNLVHPHAYIESTTQSAQLDRIFGITTGHNDIDCILRAQRRAVGGTLDAARWAAEQDGRIAFNLGGGFHHAGPDKGGGFCVYNDIAVAISELRRNGYDEAIAIVDLDFHQGDGNLQIFADDPSVLTFSIHGSVWSDATAVADCQVLLPEGTDDAHYHRALRQHLPEQLEQHHCEFVFYVAGNDVLEGDDLGSFSMTPAGVFNRDRFVLNLARQRGCSVVVTLGGGYSQDAWWTSANFLRWALSDEERLAPEQPLIDFRGYFTEVARTLDPLDLQQEEEENWALTEEELTEELMGPGRPTHRILDYYSVQGFELALEKYGLLAKLREKGFEDIQIRVDPKDSSHQRVTVHGSREDAPPLLLADVAVRRRTLSTPSNIDPSNTEPPMSLNMLSLEWLQLQDPSLSFPDSRVPFPGQDHPGIGMVRDVFELLRQACIRLELDGVVTHPSRYHIAVLGTKSFSFMDPREQGKLDALQSLMGDYELSVASRFVEQGHVRTSDGTVVAWEPVDYVAPVSERFRAYFSSEAYSHAREASRKALERAGLCVAGGVARGPGKADSAQHLPSSTPPR